MHPQSNRRAKRNERTNYLCHKDFAFGKANRRLALPAISDIQTHGEPLSAAILTDAALISPCPHAMPAMVLMRGIVGSLTRSAGLPLKEGPAPPQTALALGKRTRPATGNRQTAKLPGMEVGPTAGSNGAAARADWRASLAFVSKL